MSILFNELDLVQNPALGAVLLWHFGRSFQADDDRPAAFHALFLVLPLLFHRKSVEIVESTRKASGLVLFAAKLGEERENLLAVHERVRALRTLTLQSVGIGIKSGRLSLDYTEAVLRANALPDTSPKLIVAERLKSMPGSAEKLGYWFSKAGLGRTFAALGVEP